MFFDVETIDRLRETYNKEHTHEPAIPKHADANTTWTALKERLHSQCKTGRAECIITSLMTRPKAPAEWKVNPEDWLSNDDIEKIEKSYQSLFGGYNYVGTFPIDFDSVSETGTCLISALCSMDIRSIAKSGREQLGIVFNTDVSTGPGKHWVAVFCDLRNELEYPRMTYFDSYAQSPEPEIKRLMKRWKQEWDATGVHSKPMELTYNKTRHQYKDSECGMYCIYFHYCCLTGIPMERRVPDEVVRGLRGLLFRV
jgi:hypothetical protein